MRWIEVGTFRGRCFRGEGWLYLWREELTWASDRFCFGDETRKGLLVRRWIEELERLRLPGMAKILAGRLRVREARGGCTISGTTRLRNSSSLRFGRGGNRQRNRSLPRRSDSCSKRRRWGRRMGRSAARAPKLRRCTRLRGFVCDLRDFSSRTFTLRQRAIGVNPEREQGLYSHTQPRLASVGKKCERAEVYGSALPSRGTPFTV
jgi:hypothetical protein